MKSIMAALLCCIPLISGCSATVISDQYTRDGLKSGIPYNLPKTVMAIKATVARNDDGSFKDIQFSLTPKYVPDPDALFYLSPKNHMMFESDHHIKLKNGLLTSLETIDDGKAGEVVVSVVNSAINFYQASVGLATSQSATKNPLITANATPTDGEVQLALAMISGDSFSFTYSPDMSRTKLALESIPGTDGLLYLASETTVISNPSSSPSESAEANSKANVDFGGVFTRSLQPADAKMELTINKDKLRSLRVAAIEEAISTGKLDIAKLEKDKQEKTKQKIKHCKNNTSNIEKKGNRRQQRELLSLLKIDTSVSAAKLSAVTSRLADLDKTILLLTEEISQCSTATKSEADVQKSIDLKNLANTALDKLKTINTAYVDAEDSDGNPVQTGPKAHIVLQSDFTIKQNQDTVLVTDNRNLKIPLGRSWLGKSTNSLVFSDGIITDFHSIDPSEGLLIASSLYDVSAKILQLPAEIFDLKSLLLGKKSDLAGKQIELNNKLDELAGLEAEKNKVNSRIELLAEQTKLLEKRVEFNDQKDKLAGTQFQTNNLTKQTALTKQQILLTTSNQSAQTEQEKLTTQIQKADADRQLLLIKQEETLRTAQPDSEISRIEAEIERLDAQNLLIAAQKRVADSQLELLKTQKSISDQDASN